MRSPVYEKGKEKALPINILNCGLFAQAFGQFCFFLVGPGLQ